MGYQEDHTRGPLRCFVTDTALIRAINPDEYGGLDAEHLDPYVVLVLDMRGNLTADGEAVDTALEATPSVARQLAAGLLNAADEADKMARERS